MLYIMRHGKTNWNKYHKLQGRTDIPLNDEGKEMAMKAYLEYKNVHFDVCYSSPLSRALETANIVLKDRDIPIITDERLVEMSFGEYEGIENSFKDPSCPINVMFTNPEKYTHSIGGAETFEELFRRTGSFLKEVIEPLLKEGKDVLIVGHGMMNLSIISQIRNIPIDKFWSVGIEQCKLIEL